MRRLFFHTVDRICILMMRTFLRDRYREIDRADTDRELAKQPKRPGDLFGGPVQPFDLAAAATDEPDCHGLQYRTLRFASPHATEAIEGESSRSDHPTPFPSFADQPVAALLTCPHAQHRITPSS